MARLLFKLGLMVSLLFAVASSRAEAVYSEKMLPADHERAPAERGTRKRVMVIPVRDVIDQPVLYIIRRGLKEAIDRQIEVVILDMDTPGGSLATTFEILEALEKFPGETITFVNKDAISAGSFIAAATREIYFAPNGVIGAAAPVNSTGQDIDKTMKAKVVSYLKARIRAISEGKGYRGEVISAMIDETSEFKIGDRTLKKKDELLSLTAIEASEQFGDPPQPLLAAGIAKNVDELLASKFGEGGYVITRVEATWSERVAQYLNLQPVQTALLALGLLAAFIEFKTPGFGVFGVSGGVLLGLLFFGSYVAGLSGHEPVLFFAVGVGLVVLELFIFPGVAVMALTGIVMILGSLVWAMADLWPNEPLSIAWSGDAFVQPLYDLMTGLIIAVVLGAVLVRFLPRGWFFGRMILESSIAGTAQVSGMSPAQSATVNSLIGKHGIVVTPLRPVGQVEVDGRRFEARLAVGTADRGDPVVVTGRSDFGLTVEKGDTT
jgi:membrane-bound serine protease (ClpP class)